MKLSLIENHIPGQHPHNCPKLNLFNYNTMKVEINTAEEQAKSQNVVAAWENDITNEKSKRLGESCIKIKLEKNVKSLLLEQGESLVLFINSYKKADNQPDYRGVVYKDTPKEKVEAAR